MDSCDWLVLYVYKRDGETTDHLLLHCPSAREMRNMVFSLFEIKQVMPRGVVELLASWPSKFSKHSKAMIWNMIPYCLLWVFGRRGMLRLLKGVRDWFLTWSFIPQNFFWVNNCLKCLYFATLSDLLDSCTFHASFWLTFCCVHSTLSMYVGSLYSFILFSMKNYYLSKKEKKIIMSGEVWMTGPSCLMGYIW